MAIEFIGMIGVRPEGADGAAVHVIGGAIDMGWVRDFAQAHERAGFDKVLVGYTSTSADGFLISAYAAGHTERLGYLLAHRPGFVAPTLAARKAATLDQLSGGRLALHIITGGSDADQARDGDAVDHDTRYRRTDEYLGLMRRVWTEARPFDHAGEFFRVTAAYSDVKPIQMPVESLRAKPVGIVAMGATLHHYLGMDWQLRAVLAWFGALVVPTSVYLEPGHFQDVKLTDPAARAGLADLVAALVAMAGHARDEASPPPLAAGRD